MKIIGITGPTGSGKTTALGVLEKLGVFIIDCDSVYHNLLNHNTDMLNEIERSFPTATENGTLNRKKLGAIVFSNPEQLALLNELTHKYVSIEVNALINKKKSDVSSVIAIDAIALIESGLARICHPVIAVVADYETRVERLVKRENITREYAVLRINSQKNCDWYRENCDIILENNGSLQDFENTCWHNLKQILGGDNFL